MWPDAQFRQILFIPNYFLASFVIFKDVAQIKESHQMVKNSPNPVTLIEGTFVCDRSK
jgi:hypothetical protein